MQGRAFKYQFDIEIQKIQMHIPIHCFVELSWRRGNKSIQTKNKIEIFGHETEFVVNQKLSMISTCYLDDNHKKFNQKNSALNLILHINNIPKSGGNCPLQLTQILNPLNFKECVNKTMSPSFIKCPISMTGKIFFVLSATYLQEMIADERSTGSGISSVLNFSDSNFSLCFNQRKYQIPSKDSIENSRTSAKKSQDGKQHRRRLDTPGQFGSNVLNTIIENTQPQLDKANLKKKLSERFQDAYQIKSKEKQRVSSMKQLKQEKLRQEKFKLETQNTQLKVFVDQQTKRLNEYVKENLNLKEQVKFLTQKNIKAVNQVNRLAQQNGNIIIQLRKEVSRIEEKKTQENYQYKQKIIDLQNQIGSQMREIEHKIIEKDRYETLKDEYQVMKNRFQKSEADRMKLQEQLIKQTQAYNKKHSETHLKLNQKQNFIETIKREFEKTYGQKQELIKIRNQLNLKNQELVTKLNSVSETKHKQINCLQQKLLLANNQYKLLQRALINNNETIKAKEKEIKQKEQQEKIYLNYNQQLQSRIEQLNQKSKVNDEQTNKIITQLQQQINNLNMIIYRKQDEIKNRCKVQSSLTHSLQSLEQKILICKLNEEKNIKCVQDRITVQYRQKQQKCRIEIQNKNHQIQRLRNQLCPLKQQYERLILLNRQLQCLNQTSNHNIQLLIADNQYLHCECKNWENKCNQNKKHSYFAEQEIFKLQQNLNSYSKTMSEYENIIKQQSNQMQLLNEIIQKNEQDKIIAEEQGISINDIMKENIQFQIELKVKEQDLKKYALLSNDLNNLKYRLQIQETNCKEYEQQACKLEKELKDKNRAYMLQSEKAKMYLEQRNNYQNILNEKSFALDIEKDKSEILEKNIKDIQNKYEEILKVNRQLQSNLRILNSDISRRHDKSEQIKMLEKRNKELEIRESQKIIILEELNKNLFKSNQTIKQLHRVLEIKSKQLLNRQKCMVQIQNKYNSNQQLKKKIFENNSLINQKKNLQKKCELLFQQICNLRQKIDQQTKNAVSVSNNLQLSQRIGTLQNQLSKRDEKIKKLERQNNKLEEQNIQLNIRIMKELTEMQKRQEGIKTEYSKTLHKVFLSESQI